MSYFKPLNSNENNLHLIRLCIDNNAFLLWPSKNQLPPSITLTLDNNNNININYKHIYNNYTSIFLSNPNVTIERDDNDVFNNGNFTINMNNENNTEILLMGPKSNGPVFAVSNRGWKFSNDINYNNLLYSDMIVGIKHDNPKYNLDINGSVGTIINKLKNNTNISNILLSSYNNVIDIVNTDNTISLPKAIRDGQLLNIIVGNVEIDGKIELNIGSNIQTIDTSNIILKNTGESVSLCSYNNNWLITNKNLRTNPIINYNTLNASDYNLNNISGINTLLNGYLVVMNLNANVNIDLPSDIRYNGYNMDLVIGSVTSSYRANLILSNITTNKSSLILSNISDKIKLLCTGTKWLVIDSN